MSYSEVPSCPVCNATPDLERLYETLASGSDAPVPCCQHLVPTLEFGCQADDLVRLCGGQRLWDHIRASLPPRLKERWRGAAEEGQSRDLEGDYFIKQFVEPCPSVVRVDRLYHDVGSVGCASVVCTPFVWVKDRKAFAQQLLRHLSLRASPSGRARSKRRGKKDCNALPHTSNKRQPSKHPRKANSPPQPLRTQAALDLDAINERHALGFDKWYRMLGIGASEPTAFKNGIVYLDVRTYGNSQRNSSIKETVRKLVKNWPAQKELMQAKGWSAHIYRDGRLLKRLSGSYTKD